MTIAVPVPPRSKHFWLKVMLAVVAILSFMIVVIEERLMTWWQQDHIACTSSVYADQAPFFYGARIMTESYMLCGQNLMLLYSGITKTPLWVSQYFSAQPQKQQMIADVPQLSAHHQVQLKAEQIPNDRYDHILSLTTANQQLSAMIKVPFQSQQQLQQWQAIDQTLHEFSQHYHQNMYVITGTDYGAEHLQRIANQIWVPQGFYKAVYIPDTGVIGAYYLSNQTPNSQVEYISICALEEKLNMQLFPQLSSEQKRDVYQLPLQHLSDFDWQYAYWDSSSQCEPNILKQRVDQVPYDTIFVATPWLARLQTAALNLTFDVLDWVIARLASG
jgi:endonuclease G, mitochondrial